MNSVHLLNSGLKQLHIDVDQSCIDTLIQFVELLKKWNKAYNLSSIEDTAEIISKHILDSLSVVPYLKGHYIIDVGSGAGLPGIPLAIMCKDKEFILMDANAKKTRFIQQCCIEIELKNVQVIHQRVELYKPTTEFDTVVSRAYAASDKFFTTTQHLTTHGQFILMLGKQSTLQNLPNNMQQIKVYPVEIPYLNASRHIAIATNKCANG